MVCLPCVAVPLLLFLWRILSPFILRFIPWGKPEPGEKAIDNKEKSPISCDSTGCYWSRPKVPAEESKCPIESDKNQIINLTKKSTSSGGSLAFAPVKEQPSFRGIFSDVGMILKPVGKHERTAFDQLSLKYLVITLVNQQDNNQK